MKAKRVDFVRLQLVREGSLLYRNRRVTQPSDAEAMFRELFGQPDREFFGVLTLDAKNQPTSLFVASVGTISSALAIPRDVYKTAILKNSASVIFCHNHPSGDPTASREDIDITHRLIEAGDIIGIKCLDHIILGDGVFVSLKEKGLM